MSGHPMAQASWHTKLTITTYVKTMIVFCVATVFPLMFLTMQPYLTGKSIIQAQEGVSSYPPLLLKSITGNFGRSWLSLRHHWLGWWSRAPPAMENDITVTGSQNGGVRRWTQRVWLQSPRSFHWNMQLPCACGYKCWLQHYLAVGTRMGYLPSCASVS